MAKHAGNIRFRDWVALELCDYVMASKAEKTQMILKVVDKVRDAARPIAQNGFVRFDLVTKRWYAVGVKKSRDVTAQAFRDALSFAYSSSRDNKREKRREHEKIKKNSKKAAAAVPSSSSPFNSPTSLSLTGIPGAASGALPASGAASVEPTFTGSYNATFPHAAIVPKKKSQSPQRVGGGGGHSLEQLQMRELSGGEAIMAQNVFEAIVAQNVQSMMETAESDDDYDSHHSSSASLTSCEEVGFSRAAKTIETEDSATDRNTLDLLLARFRPLSSLSEEGDPFAPKPISASSSLHLRMRRKKGIAERMHRRRATSAPSLSTLQLITSVTYPSPAAAAAAPAAASQRNNSASALFKKNFFPTKNLMTQDASSMGFATSAANTYYPPPAAAAGDAKKWSSSLKDSFSASWNWMQEER